MATEGAPRSAASRRVTSWALARPAVGLGWREYIPVALITALALALRLYANGAQSYWSDELGSVMHIRNGFRRVIEASFIWETNPPLYYVLLRIWVLLFGDGEAATRSLSAIIGAATVPAIFNVGRVISGRQAGNIAALLFALATIQIQYGQETRQYALMVLGLTIALFGLAKALVESDEVGVPPRAAGLIFVGGMTLAIYSHNVSVIYWFSMNVCLLVFSFIHSDRGLVRGRSTRFLRAWAGYNLLTLALAAPQIYAIIKLREAGTVAWIPYPSLKSFLRMLESLFFSDLPRESLAPPIGLLVAFAALLWAGIVSRRRRLVMTVGLLLPLVALTSMTLISFFRPIMLTRTLLWIPVPIYAFVACAVSNIDRAAFRAMALCAAVGFETSASAAQWLNFVKEDWRSAVPFVAGASLPSDLFGFSLDYGGLNAFEYYWPGRFDETRCRILNYDDWSWSSAPDHGASSGCRSESIGALVHDEILRGRRAWLVAKGGRTNELLKFRSSMSPFCAIESKELASAMGSMLIVRLSDCRQARPDDVSTRDSGP